MTGKKYRVNDLVKYDYSEIGEYIDEMHTDKPLRNDEIVDLLNTLYEENRQLREDYIAYQIAIRRELLYHYKDLTRQLECKLDCLCCAQSRARIIAIMNTLGVGLDELKIIGDYQAEPIEEIKKKLMEE